SVGRDGDLAVQARDGERVGDLGEGNAGVGAVTEVLDGPGKGGDDDRPGDDPADITPKPNDTPPQPSDRHSKPGGEL
ncbi:hypothetical protein HK101_005716, partial [Irineochytrium annulatum]